MPVAAILSLSEEGLDYQWFSEEGKSRHVGIIRWSDIETIEVFKRDLFSYDLICIQLTLTNDDWFEFDEEDPNWKKMMDAIPLHLSGCQTFADWFSSVAFPAFETNLRRIYERNR